RESRLGHRGQAAGAQTTTTDPGVRLRLPGGGRSPEALLDLAPTAAEGLAARRPDPRTSSRGRRRALELAPDAGRRHLDAQPRLSPTEPARVVASCPYPCFVFP